MAGTRKKPDQVVSTLRQVEVLQGQGTSNGVSNAFEIHVRSVSRNNAAMRLRPGPGGQPIEITSGSSSCRFELNIPETETVYVDLGEITCELSD